MKRSILWLALAALVTVGAGGCSSEEKKAESAAAVASDKAFEGKFVLVEFGADWCKYCHQQEQVLDAMRRAGTLPADLKIVHVDVEAEPALAERYKIEGLPTLMLFRDGKMTARAEGLHPEADLKRFLQSP